VSGPYRLSLAEMLRLIHKVEKGLGCAIARTGQGAPLGALKVGWMPSQIPLVSSDSAAKRSSVWYTRQFEMDFVCFCLVPLFELRAAKSTSLWYQAEDQGGTRGGIRGFANLVRSRRSRASSRFAANSTTGPSP
jgi:hypothetical protein